MLINLDIDLTMLPKDKITEGKNGHKYIKLTAATMKQPDKFGNDMTVFIAQSKEEREHSDRLYCGKGKTFGNKQEQPSIPIVNGGLKGDLPF